MSKKWGGPKCFIFSYNEALCLLDELQMKNSKKMWIHSMQAEKCTAWGKPYRIIADRHLTLSAKRNETQGGQR